MAQVKVKKKKQLTANLPDMSASQSMIGANIMGAQPVPSAKMGPIGGPIPSAMTGEMPVLKAEGLSQEIEAMEMRNQGAPAAKPVSKVEASPTKVKVKKKQAVMPSEPMSPQTWANIGNNPADYPEYLAAFKKQSGKK
jgi:hypothetical protein